MTALSPGNESSLSEWTTTVGSGAGYGAISS